MFPFGFCIANLCSDVVAAIATVVTVAEILKNNGLALEKSKSYFSSEYSIFHVIGKKKSIYSDNSSFHCASQKL